MKTNKKHDTLALKKSHRIELVMQETGERFEVDSADPNIWRSLTTRGLIADLYLQIYELSQPGMKTETGDVYKWLQHRYDGWHFGMAVRYLRSRSPDSNMQEEPVKAEKTAQLQEARYIFDIDEPSDKWQEKALQIGGDEIRKYFSKSWIEIFELLQSVPTRFLPVIVVDVDECAECGMPFNWEEPKTIAYYSQGLEYCGEDMPENERHKFILDVYIEGVICEKCMRTQVSNYLALSYCFQSARSRSQAETENWLNERRLERENNVEVEYEQGPS